MRIACTIGCGAARGAGAAADASTPITPRSSACRIVKRVSMVAVVLVQSALKPNWPIVLNVSWISSVVDPLSPFNEV